MFKQTIRLFIKAFIIGVLVNMGLQHVSAGGSVLPTEDNPPQYHEQQILRQFPADTEFSFSDPAER